MNKKDEIGNRQGYWEEEILNRLYKGNYIDSKKHGVWEYYTKNTIDYIIKYENDKPIYSKAWSHSGLRYVLNKGRNKLIHNEEYE